MPSSRAVVPLALLATAALAEPAAAAAPWGPPQTVAEGFVLDPALSFARESATGVATLQARRTTRLMVLQAGEATPAVGRRDVASIEDGPVAYGEGRTVVLRRRGAGGNVVRLGWSFGRTDGTVGAERTLRTVDLRPGEAELAVSPSGNAVIAFAEDRGGSTRVWLATRRAGSDRFSRPAIVRGSGSARSLAVSVNDRGRYVLAYALGAGRTRVVEARVGSVGGSPGPLRRVGTQLGLARVDAVVARTGRTTVAWSTRDGGEEQNDPTQLRTNVVPAGRSTFAGQVVVDRGAPGALATELNAPSLAAAPDGTTAVGYSLSGRFGGGGTGGDAAIATPARVAVQDDAARFGTPQELSPAASVGSIAAREDGTFAVPYVTGVSLEGRPGALFVALGRRAFAPGELVASDAAPDAAVAFEPGPTGAPVVLWPRADEDGAAMARRAG